MSKIIKLTSHHPESSNKPKGKIITFSPKQKEELFTELSTKERGSFVKYDFGFHFFANTPGGTVEDANKIFNGKVVPLGGLAAEYEKAIESALKGGKNLKVSDYGSIT